MFLQLSSEIDPPSLHTLEVTALHCPLTMYHWCTRRIANRTSGLLLIDRIMICVQPCKVCCYYFVFSSIYWIKYKEFLYMLWALARHLSIFYEKSCLKTTWTNKVKKYFKGGIVLAWQLPTTFVSFQFLVAPHVIFLARQKTPTRSLFSEPRQEKT